MSKGNAHYIEGVGDNPLTANIHKRSDVPCNYDQSLIVFSGYIRFFLINLEKFF